MRYKIIFVLLILSVLCVFGYQYRDDGIRWISSYAKANQDDPVPTMKVIRRDYNVTVRADGELMGFELIPVRAPRLRSGALKIAWMADEGTVVGSGDVLVRFDNVDAALAVEQNQNTVASYQHQITKTEGDAESQQEVNKIDLNSAGLDVDYASKQIRKDETIFSRWEIEESIMSSALADYREENLQTVGSLNKKLSAADLKILGIERKRAESEMDIAKQTLAALEVRADSPGVVLYQRDYFSDVQVGSEVWPGQPLLNVINMNRFKAQLQIPETDVSGVQKGKKIQATLDAFPSRVFGGVIQKVDPVAQQFSQKDPRKYFTCDVILDVPTEMMERLKPGMAVHAQIEAGLWKDAAVLPKSAIVKQDNKFVAFVKTPTGYISKEVKIVDGDYGFYVVDGIESGDLVCLQHPFEKQRLHLPDFSAPTTSTQGRHFRIRR